MALFSDGTTKQPLMDESMSATMRRRMNELWGVGFILVALGLGMALWSYNVADPSRLSATAAPAMNLLGEAGAFLADEMIRHAGLGSWALVLFFGVWGVRFVLHLGEERIWARLLMLLPVLAIAPIFASTHAVYDGWQLAGTGLGGSLGDTGARMLLDIVPMPDAQALLIISLVVGLVLTAIGLVTLGFTWDEITLLWSWLTQSLRNAVSSVTAQVAGLTGSAIGGARDKVREMRAKPRSETMEPAEPTGAWRAKMAGTEVDDDLAREPVNTAWNANQPEDDMEMDAELEPIPPEGGLVARLPKVPKMPSVGLPKVSGFKMPKMPKLAMPSLKRQEPELRFDRFTDTDLADRTFNTSDAHPTEEAVTSDPAPAQEDRALSAVFDRLRADGDFTGAEMPGTPDLDQDKEPAPQAFEEAEAPQVAAPHVKRDTRRPRTSKQAEAERQPSLALDASPPAVYEVPPLALLQKPVNVVRNNTSDVALEDNARMLETVLEDYGVRGEIVAVRPGPVVTLYELEPAPGLKASRVIGLSDDIARSMSALAARVSTVPGRSIIGIELPNTEREKVWLRDVFEKREYGDARYPLALALGKDISGAPIISNLAKMPHLLIAGTTGSGKSVAINTMILSLLYRLTPQQCRLIMIDPKMLELSVYDNIPHLLAPVVTDPKKAIVALKWAVAEMEERYRKMSKMGVRNIDGYNARVRAALEKGEDFSRTVQTGFDQATGEPIYETENLRTRRNAVHRRDRRRDGRSDDGCW